MDSNLNALKYKPFYNLAIMFTWAKSEEKLISIW